MTTSAPEQQGAVAYYAGKVVRHLRWARTEGIGRLVEEDRLDPRERVGTAVRKARWRRRNGVAPGTARPVYVVGLQRSGTNMLMRGIDLAPEVEVRNENDRTVFHRFRLRSDDVLTQTLRASRHALVLVKPLCESHRVDELLDLPEAPGGRALWVFREPVARARSEVSKFRDANLRALRTIAAGEGESVWQGRRLPADSVELVRSFDTEAMTPESAAVLFWVVRNQLYFDLGLDRRDDVLPVGYDAFVADPAGQMRRLCAFIGLPYRSSLHEHVVPRESHGSDALPVDARAASLAEELHGRLLRAATEREVAP
ncbi:MAG TPA: sulfotransferase [Pedococcus sp.]